MELAIMLWMTKCKMYVFWVKRKVQMLLKRLKVFNLIARINEAVKHLSWNCNCKFNSATSNSNQKWNNKTPKCEWKNYQTCKEDYSWKRIAVLTI